MVFDRNATIIIICCVIICILNRMLLETRQRANITEHNIFRCIGNQWFKISAHYNNTRYNNTLFEYLDHSMNTRSY
jgi:hypothetical protein